MDGRRFDVVESDPLLEIFLVTKKLLNLNRKWEMGVYKLFTLIAGKLGEIAVNGFDHFFSFDGIKSVEGVANQPKILTRCGESIYSH
jgi:hypothetical protein